MRVAVTGAAGAIGYALLMRLASGRMFGPQTDLDLRLIETTPGMKPLKGVAMEIQDGAFPLVTNVEMTDDLVKGFGDVDWCVLVGARPRGPGMERSDLMSANAEIFAKQGKVIGDVGKDGVKVLVVGNPANTNAMVLSENAGDASAVKKENVFAMTRLDQNRAMAQVAKKVGTGVGDVEKVVVWGNHSATQFPDLMHATVGGKKVLDLVDDKWYKEEFIPRVQKRGAEIIGARGASSAASAASAAIDHVHDLQHGSGDKWQSMGVVSDGSYGIDEGIWYSVPCICKGGGKWSRVKDLAKPNKFAASMMEATRKELLEERDAVLKLLPQKKRVTSNGRKRGRSSRM